MAGRKASTTNPRQEANGAALHPGPAHAGDGSDEAKRALKVQAALYQIADAASAVRDMQSFYKKLHKIVGKLMRAENFFIAVYDEKRDLITWPYHADTVDVEPRPPMRLAEHHGATGWVLRHGKTLADVDGSYQAAIERGEAESIGTDSDGIAVPLKVKSRTIGVVLIQSYIKGIGYQVEDIRVLEFVAQHIATALTRARAIEETRQSNEELIRSNKIQAALYKIADAASASHDMQEFYAETHRIVGGLMYARNFFIAIFDEQSGLVTWPYHSDEKDVDVSMWLPMPLNKDRGSTAYVIRSGETVHTARDGIRLLEENKFEVIGTMAVDAIIVPLKTTRKVLGALAIQSYTPGIVYSRQDVKILEFVAQHIATALTRARAMEAERQRSAELAILNTVGEAMAKTLDVRTVTKIVGDKVREIFKAEIVDIQLFDEQTRLIHSAYNYCGGQYFDAEPPWLLGEGMTSKVIISRHSLLLNNLEEMSEHGAISYSTAPAGSEEAQSYMGVPITVEDRVVGVVDVQSYQPNAFDENGVRLLQTLSSNMGVAIENARLFEAEQQRIAELAIINSVQEGLASQLDMQAIYDLVGDQVQKIFHVAEVEISSYDPKSQMISFAYWSSQQGRIIAEPLPLGRGLNSVLIETLQPLILGTAEEIVARGAVMPDVVPEQDRARKSFIGVPILSGNRAIGAISLHDAEKEHAYGPSELNLLTTISNSMGVALENARLFDETQRLLKETEQRAAELAIINSVQAALAEELDIQGIYDAVGDKIHEIFHSSDMQIRVYDPKTNLVNLPYAYDNGQRITVEPFFLDKKGVTSHVLRTRKTLVINENLAQELEKFGSYTLPGTIASKSGVFVPLVAGERARGLIMLKNIEREHAFSDSEVHLLETLANSMSVALENARLFDETQRLLKETKDRNAEPQHSGHLQRRRR